MKLTVLEGGNPALSRAATEIRQLIAQGADIKYHRLAQKQMEEFDLEDTDIKTMLGKCRVVQIEPTGVLDPPTYVARGDRLEQSEDGERRIQKEFAIKVSVEATRHPKRLGVIKLWQLEETG